MESKKSHIGLVLEDNSAIVDCNIRAYERLEVKLNPIAQAYETLGIGKFSKEILFDLLVNKTKGIEKNILNEIEAQLSASGITIPALIQSHKSNALAQISPFIQMVNSFVALYELECSRDRVSLDLMSVVNDKGLIVINRAFKEKVKNHFAIKIETDEQSDLYDRFLELKKVFEEFMKQAKRVTIIDQEIDYWSRDAITFIGEKGELKLNPSIILEMNSDK